MLISFDTETTGLDLYSGAMPYFFTSCDEAGEISFIECPVDPETRRPIITDDDLADIQGIINGASEIVLHNAKFDATAISRIIPGFDWPWKKTHDTLIAGHILASNQPHNLTDMAIHWLGRNIEPYEIALKHACTEARRFARAKLPDWRIAREGLREMPSAGESSWKADGWLPKAIATHAADQWDVPEDWKTVLSNYANADSETTLLLWQVLKQELHRRGLWVIYLERMKCLPIAMQMERDGVTCSKDRIDELNRRYRIESNNAETTCNRIAFDLGAELALPKSGNNKSLREFAFNHLKLKPIKWSEKTGEPSLDKESIEHWLATCDGEQLAFVRALKDKRARDTAVNYMDGYLRYARPVKGHQGYLILHPNLNPTGTDTLRWSSNNPNEQNISKREGFNLRYCFGPLPGREWWSLDAKNIELRIPAYESGESALIQIFDHPDDPPYFGSYHLAIFDLLHPEKFREHGKQCKELFESTWYQWVKNGNFAIIYGAQETTADNAYHVRGAFQKIRKRFPRIAALADRMIRKAERDGFVETIPDREVDSTKGYPLLCTRTNYGGVMPTVPLNYHIQGTACWWTMRAMIKVDMILAEWNRGKSRDKSIKMVLQVHDELVLDFPAGKGKEPYLTNLPKVRRIASEMAKCGEAIGVPTTVGIEYHAETWATGKVIQ